MKPLAALRQRVRKRPRLAALVSGSAVVLLVAVTVGSVLFWPRGATPITGKEALEEFRSLTGERAGGGPPPTNPVQGSGGVAGQSTAGAPTNGSEPANAAPDPGSGAAAGGAATPAVAFLRPPRGVYTYAAGGREIVHLGPASQTRTLADTVTATVLWTPGEDCWVFKHNLFAEHTEDTTYCPGSDGSLRITSHTKHQKLGAVTATAQMTCDVPLLAASPAPGQSWATSCDMATQTPIFTARSTHTGEVTVVASEEIVVGGVTLPTWHVAIRRAVGGDMSGHWNEDIWFSRVDGIPVRITRDAELAGPATFTESSSFALLDPNPRT
ncbi:MAG: hypothetical protein IT198_04680 [Acidimicrobiia bacterium]|nr:hypothetical protein [Acidimicrobiia bacterium]